jgi:hypothetical protein
VQKKLPEIFHSDLWDVWGGGRGLSLESTSCEVARSFCKAARVSWRLGQKDVRIARSRYSSEGRRADGVGGGGWGGLSLKSATCAVARVYVEASAVAWSSCPEYPRRSCRCFSSEYLIADISGWGSGAGGGCTGFLCTYCLVWQPECCVPLPPCRVRQVRGFGATLTSITAAQRALRL